MTSQLQKDGFITGKFDMNWCCWEKYRVSPKKADGKAANAWTENNVAELIEKYGPDSIYNTDETGFLCTA